MKKILIITPYCPYPPHKSGGIHALFHMIKENKKFNNKLDLLYYDEKDEAAEAEIEKYLDNVFYVDLRKKSKLVRINSLLKRIPYGMYQYEEELLNVSDRYDKIIFDQPLSMDFINKINAESTVLMAYDSMSLYFARKADMSNTKLSEKIYNKLQSKYYRIVQKENYSKFNKIFFVSENDALYEKELNTEVKDKVDNITLGVDYNKFDPGRYASTQNKNLIFTGIMSYAPNKDAAMFFATKIMPEILKKDSEVKFIIAGKNPDQDICALQSDNIHVTGFVDDMVECIASASVYVSPLRYGTGMKNKVLEAMSCGKAIVASDISVEGISQLKHGSNIYVPKNEKEWVEYVLKALNDKLINDMFGRECREIIIKNYNWENAYNIVFND